jgi:DNA-binding NtrC family response regulator
LRDLRKVGALAWIAPSSRCMYTHAMRNEADVPARILSFEATEDEVIAWYMRGVLDRARGNQCEAQRVLAIDRSTIRRRIEKLGLRR